MTKEIKEIKEVKTQARRLVKHLKTRYPDFKLAAGYEALAAAFGHANWQTMRSVVESSRVNTEAGRHILEWPFLQNNETGLPVITTVLLQDAEDPDYVYHYALHHVEHELLLEIVAAEAEGSDSEAYAELDDCKDLALDWGDEFEGEGLSVSELLGMARVDGTTWKLRDGRLIGFAFLQRAGASHADVKVSKPEQAASKSLSHEMAEKYAGGNLWGQHPDYPRADWKAEVDNDDTILGYWEWVMHAVEMAADDCDN